MGVFEDAASGSVSITASKPRVGLDRASAEQLLAEGARKGSPTIDAAYDALDEVSQIDQLTGTPSGGDYTLTVEAPVLGVTYTTAAIAFDAVEATIQTALDTASPVGVTDAAIVVAEENTAGLDDGFCDFTVALELLAQPVYISIDNSGVTGIGAAQTVTRTVAGQPARNSLQALYDMNVIAGAVPSAGDAPTWTRPESTGQTRPRTGLLKDLALQTIFDTGRELEYDALVVLYPQIGLPAIKR